MPQVANQVAANFADAEVVGIPVDTKGRRIGQPASTGDPCFSAGEELAFGKVVWCGDEVESEYLRINAYPTFCDRFAVLDYPVIQQAARSEVGREPGAAARRDSAISQERARQ